MTEPAPYRPLSYLEANAARRPDAPAIYEAGETMSFSELLNAVRAFMVILRDAGLRPGEVVAATLPNVWPYVAVEIAIPALGAVIMPLPASLGARELEFALGSSGAALVVLDPETDETAAEVAGQMASVRAIISSAELVAAAGRAAPDLEPYPTAPEDIVQIALTSGTLGSPKLASLSAELKQLTFEGYVARLAISPDDRVLVLSPITQGVGEMCLYTLRCGACLVMAHEHRFSPEHELELAERSRATVIVGVPTMFTRMLDSPTLEATDLSSARLTGISGQRVRPDLARRWEQQTGSRVCSYYGAMDIGQLSVASPEDPAEKRWETVGRPHETAEWMISDEAGRALGTGEVGEICMRGPLVQGRYWGEDSGPYGDDGWARFGDLGFVDTEGFVHVIGRSKDIIIRGGNNISPHEVEGILGEHPDIADVCVVGRPDADLGERSVAFVVPRAGATVSLEAVRGFLAEAGLARYKWPEYISNVAELPVGDTGKVSRQELRRRAAEDVNERTTTSGRN